MKIIKLVGAIGVVCFLGTACETLPGPQGPQGPPGEPAAQAMAAIDRDGNLLRGVNISSTERTDTGLYRVTFDADVDLANGYYLITPGLNTACNTVGMAAYDGTALRVSFGDPTSTTPRFIDCAFSLVVF